jgi:hypothetical protein
MARRPIRRPPDPAPRGPEDCKPAHTEIRREADGRAKYTLPIRFGRFAAYLIAWHDPGSGAGGFAIATEP